MSTDYNFLTKKLVRLRKLYESAIRAKNWANVIRSSVIIKELHDYVVKELMNHHVKRKFISQDKKIMGYFKTKTQDVLVAKNIKEPLISVNVRSQLSSIQKNYDTLFERLIAESTNLHEKHPSMVCGYLYLLPTIGYSTKEAKKGRILRNEHFNWEKYLWSFSLLADRKNKEAASYEYEEICLLAVDFSKAKPEVLQNIEDFRTRRLVSDKFAEKFNYGNLSIDKFIERLLNKFNHGNINSLTR